MGGGEEEGTKIFSVLHTDRTRSNGHTLEHMEFYLNKRKPLFDNESLEQVVQRGCGVSEYLQGDSQDSGGRSQAMCSS